MTQPLAGIRILEVGQMLAGPYSGMLLADLGAEVIKIEPPAGDIAREISPHWIGPHNAYFASLNRNKMSVTLDLSSVEGQRALGELSTSAHALIVNLRPAAIKKLGLTYVALRHWNPNLVCVALTGYGLDGPYTGRPAYDYVIQALTGVMAVTGDPEGPPTKTGYSAVDNSAGIMAALGLVAKLIQREGGQVDIAMYDVMLSQLNYLAGAWLNAGERVQRFARSAHPYLVPAQNFQTKDGWLVLFVSHDEFWRRFCSEVGRTEWLTDNRFATMAARRQNRETVVSAVATLIAERETEHWVKRLAPLDVVVAGVETLEEALAGAQAEAREMVISIPTPTGPIRVVGNPIKFVGDKVRFVAPPLLGEHNEALLQRQDPQDPAVSFSSVAARHSGASRPPISRRQLSRTLSQIANATVDEALAGLLPQPAGAARRIGVTGAPGVGKSTLISRFVEHRLDRGDLIGVIAIDPTSPFSHGAILGDRIRMERVAEHSRVFIRSFASRGAQDGLADNIADILLAMDAEEFDDVILETVGVGQVGCAVRALVDTLVLVLVPDCGDHIQAMKSGLVETADIYVVNKADLPRAANVAAELCAVTKRRRRDGIGWDPPVILVGNHDSGLSEFEQAMTKHQALVAGTRDWDAEQNRRRGYHVKSLIMRRVSEVLSSDWQDLHHQPLTEVYQLILARLRRSDWHR